MFHLYFLSSSLPWAQSNNHDVIKTEKVKVDDIKMLTCLLCTEGKHAAQDFR